MDFAVRGWFVLMVLGVSILQVTDSTLCRNMYDTGQIHSKVGHFAISEPRNTRYYVQSVVRFHCPKNYHFEDIYFRKKSYIWSKCHEYGWSLRWPTCRGIYENITCLNDYTFARHFNKSWLNETPNRKHSLYGNKAPKYTHLSTLKFRCPKGMNFLGAKGLVIMESVCLETGRWSKEWPMCKGHTCSPYRLPNAITGDENRLFKPGTSVDIRCWDGYYLTGSNWSVCKNDLSWSGFRECVTLQEYKRRCQKSGDFFEYETNGEPRCRSRVVRYDDIRKKESEKTKRIALGSAIPLTALFVIFLTLSSLYVRRLRARNGMLALAVRYQNQDHVLEMFLPTYEDAQKSKPTTPPPTFEESQNLVFPGHVDTSPRGSSRPPASPPPYAPP